MSVLDSVRKQIVPIHPEGYLFIAIFAVVSLVLHALWAPLGWIGALLLIWVEVLGHAAIGSLLIGWDSGFHYLLLLFIPAIVVANHVSFIDAILLMAAFVSGATGDHASLIIILTMVVLSVGLDVYQEHGAEKAAEALSQSSMKAYRALVYETPGFTDYFFGATPIREIAESTGAQQAVSVPNAQWSCACRAGSQRCKVPAGMSHQYSWRVAGCHIGDSPRRLGATGRGVHLIGAPPSGSGPRAKG